PDSKTLAISEGGAQKNIDLYEIPGLKKTRTLSADPAAQPAQPKQGKGGGGMGGGFFGGTGASQGMVFSTDAKALAFQAPPVGARGPGAPAGPGPAIEVFDTATGKRIGSLPSVSEGTAGVPAAFSPDHRCLAVAKMDGTVTLYELATRQPRRTYG